MGKKLFSSWSTRKGWSIAASGMVVAVGAIVLLQARSGASEQPPPPVPAPAPNPVSVLAISPGEVGEFSAPRITFDQPGVSGTVSLTQGAVLEQGMRSVFAELQLAADERTGEVVRRPVALAVVLDVSGSMSGEKIDEARRAVGRLIARMDPNDQIGLVIYNDGAQLVQPMARVGSVRTALLSRVHTIHAGGGTNIPQGLRLGNSILASASQELMRRVVLVSDGLDHSGLPLDQITGEVRGRANGGATLSALGVGTDYDERFLTNVADAGRGNYEFLARGGELSAFLTRELDQAASTMILGLAADFEIPVGWRVARVYGAESEHPTGLSGRHAVLVPVGSMYSGEQRRVLVAFDVPAGAAGTEQILNVRLHYRRPESSARHDVTLGQLALRTVSDQETVTASRNPGLHADALTTVIDVRQEQAVALWRQGRSDEAVALSVRNEAALESLNNDVPSVARDSQIRAYREDSANFRGQPASSASGRAYGLRANQARRARVRDWVSR